MQIKTLDGHSQNWQLTGHYSHANLENRSSIHLATRSLLRKNFPTLQILEEVPIPVRRSESYYLDFYIPMIRTAVEVHGEQHFKFVPFYHNNQLGFIKSQKRDREKREWCEINNIKYIEFPHYENEQLWTQRLNQ